MIGKVKSDLIKEFAKIPNLQSVIYSGSFLFLFFSNNLILWSATF